MNKISILTNKRLINISAAIVCVLALVTAYYLEFGLGIKPCPLCLIQRLLVALIAVTFLVAAIHNPQKTGTRIYNTLAFIFAILGMFTAGRQIYLQLHPMQTAYESCIPGLEYMVRNLPFSKTMSLLLDDSGSCAEVSWRFLSLSLPQWTFILFLVMAILALWQWKRG